MTNVAQNAFNLVMNAGDSIDMWHTTKPDELSNFLVYDLTNNGQILNGSAVSRITRILH